MSGSGQHVVPVGDLIVHPLVEGLCVWPARRAGAARDDGSVGWVYIHHSLDGRELTEPRD